MRDEGIVRNRLKIDSTVTNAAAFLAVQKEFGSFDRFLWDFVGGRPRDNRVKAGTRLPASTKESDALSKRTEAPGLPLRRDDHLLRLHAGGRHRQRPRDRLFPLPGLPQGLRLAMLFLDRSDVAALLSMPECIEAMASAFAAHAAGELPAPPGVLGSSVPGGGFHVKTAALGGAPGFYAAKVNANFPGNPERHGMPTIQGIIGLFDTATGRPLALLDSIEITTLRTAAASALAARLLALPDASTLLICGCGNQGRAHLRAMLQVRRLRRVLAHDRSPAQLASFIARNERRNRVRNRTGRQHRGVISLLRIGVTCTPARAVVVTAADVRSGQFIAAVGADSEGKQELDPAMLGRSRVVADLAGRRRSWANSSTRSRQNHDASGTCMRNSGQSWPDSVRAGPLPSRSSYSTARARRCRMSRRLPRSINAHSRPAGVAN